MSMPFGQPSSGEWFKPADANGHLILITTVHEIGTRFDKLANSEKPHGVFDMVDLDDGQGGKLQQHVNDSHPGIVNKLGKAQRTGEMVLGRINQAPSEKGNPAWVLGPYTPGQDDVRAMQWINAHPMNNFGQPTTPAPAPAPQQYAAAPAPAPQQQYAPAPQQYMPAPAPQYAAPAQQYTAAPAPAPAPAAAPQPAAPAATAAPALDPNNLPPEIQALLAQLNQQQAS